MTFVQLYKNGPLWADRNMGAKEPEDPGLLYSWGGVEGLSVQNNKMLSPYRNTERKELQEMGVLDGIHLSGEHDTATVLLGTGYRTPTGNELKKLIEMCRWEFVKGNKPYYKIFGTGEFSDNHIILPLIQMELLYWSSTSGTNKVDSRAMSYMWSRCLPPNISCGNHSRDWMMMIRPVKEMIKIQ